MSCPTAMYSDKKKKELIKFMLQSLSVAIPNVSNWMLHLELAFQGNALGGPLVTVPCSFQKFPHATAIMHKHPWKLWQKADIGLLLLRPKAADK